MLGFRFVNLHNSRASDCSGKPGAQRGLGTESAARRVRPNFQGWWVGVGILSIFRVMAILCLTSDFETEYDFHKEIRGMVLDYDSASENLIAQIEDAVSKLKTKGFEVKYSMKVNTKIFKIANKVS